MTRWAVLVALLLAPALAAADVPERERVAGALGRRLDAQLTRYAAYGFSGSVLIVKDGRVVLSKGYGFADVEHRIPNTPATRFEMNSMTKMFTAVAILQLETQGKLRIDDPVARHLPGFPPPKQGATIQQLARHVSGLIVEGSDLAGDSRDAFVQAVARTPAESPPGERYRYTNAGFSLLAAVIETASGETYEDYLRRHLFAPAGMSTARFRNEIPRGDPLYAHGYVGTPAALQPGPPNPYVWGTIGAGGVWATPGDMYRWVLALESRRVLSERAWRVLATPPPPPSEETFGWHVERTPEGRNRFAKGGGSDDFASQLLYYPDERVVILMATNNLRQRWRRFLNEALPRLVFQGKATPLPPIVAVRGDALRARAGDYISGTDTLRFHTGSGYLYTGGNPPQGWENRMYFPQDPDRFTGFDPRDGSQVRLRFGRGTDRSVTAVLPGGRKIRAHRP